MKIDKVFDVKVVKDEFLIDPNMLTIKSELRGRAVLPSEGELKARAASMATQGQLQSVEARKDGDKLVLVAGFTRTAAAEMIRQGFEWEGKKYHDPDFLLRVRVVEIDENLARIHNIVENAQRKSTSALDDALNQQWMRETLGYTDAQIAREYGVSAPLITHTKKILSLPPELQQEIGERNMPVTVALELAELPEEARAAFVEKYGPRLTVAQIRRDLRAEAEATVDASGEAVDAPPVDAPPAGDGVETDGTVPGQQSSSAETPGGGKTPATSDAKKLPLKDVRAYWEGWLTAQDDDDKDTAAYQSLARAVLSFMDGKKGEKFLTNALVKFRNKHTKGEG